MTSPVGFGEASLSSLELCSLALQEPAAKAVGVTVGGNIGLEGAAPLGITKCDACQMQEQRNVLLSGDLCCASLRDSRWSRLAFGKFFEVRASLLIDTDGSRHRLLMCDVFDVMLAPKLVKNHFCKKNAMSAQHNGSYTL